MLRPHDVFKNTGLELYLMDLVTRKFTKNKPNTANSYKLYASLLLE